MTLSQLEYENRPFIRAMRLETNFEDVVKVLSSHSSKDLSELCPVTGASALYYAVQRRDPDEALQLSKLLVEDKKACRADHVDKNRQTALFFAGRDGNLQCVKYLIEKGCSVAQTDAASQTVLFYAARDGRSEVVMTLLNHGIDVNAVDHLGQTALFYACRDGRMETVQIMLDRGANPNVKDKQKKTALAYAIRNGHKELSNFVKSKKFTIVSTQAAEAGQEDGMGSVVGLDAVNAEDVAAQAFGGKRRCTSSHVARVSTAPRTSVSAGNDGAPVAAEVLPGSLPLEVVQPPVQRKRYRLQYKAMPYGWMKQERSEDISQTVSSSDLSDTDGPTATLWLFAPLGKVEQLERICPKIAVWPKKGPVPPIKPQCDRFKTMWYNQALKVVDELTNYEGGWIFAKPVDCRSWNCPDYYSIVDKPMDLSTVKKKLRNWSYMRPSEFSRDIQLIFSNCYLYNRPESNISKIGNNVEMYFRNLITKLNFDIWEERQEEIEEHLRRLNAMLGKDKILAPVNAIETDDSKTEMPEETLVTDETYVDGAEAFNGHDAAGDEQISNDDDSSNSMFDDADSAEGRDVENNPRSDDDIVACSGDGNLEEEDEEQQQLPFEENGDAAEIATTEIT